MQVTYNNLIYAKIKQALENITHMLQCPLLLHFITSSTSVYIEGTQITKVQLGKLALSINFLVRK